MLNTRVEEIVEKIYSSQTISEEEHNEIILAMKKGNKDEKIHLARILSRLKDPNDFIYIEELLNMQNHTLSLIEASATYGVITIERLLPLLDSATKKKFLRENIIRVFAFMGLSDFGYIFVRYLHDEYIGVRKACLHGIEKLKLKNALKPLEILISSEKDELIKNYAQKVYNSLLC